MNLIKQKQIAELERDVFNSYFGSDVFIRNTVFSIGNVTSGEACFDTNTATDISTLRIHTNDSLIGNGYSILSEFSQYDTLILKSPNNNIAKYTINQISEDVDSDNEGHFILTLQHSFGYSTQFTSGNYTYYFKKLASEDLIEKIEDEKIRALAAEGQLEASIALLNASTLEKIENEKIRALAAEGQLEASVALLNASIQSFKEVYTYNLSQGVSTVIPHNLKTSDIIIQISEDGRLVTHEHIITSITSSTITVQPNVSAEFKIILMK